MKLWQKTKRFIGNKLRRRARTKGVVARVIWHHGRNRQPVTAVNLWQRVYRFKEKPAARAGTKRRIARERAAAKGRR